MDQLMSDFSPPRVSTSFERKVGASLCKASELAMSDQLPKFRQIDIGVHKLSALHLLQPYLHFRFIRTIVEGPKPFIPRDIIGPIITIEIAMV